MHIDLDRTQEWLNRTQSWNRTPAVRGGLVPDRRSRRQTAIGVALVLIGILLLILIPRPEATVAKAVSPPIDLPAARPDLTSASFTRTILPSPSRPQVVPARNNSLAVNSYFYRPDPGTVRIGTEVVAPPAPIWLITLPREWNSMQTPAGSSPTSVMGYESAAHAR